MPRPAAQDWKGTWSMLHSQFPNLTNEINNLCNDDTVTLREPAETDAWLDRAFPAMLTKMKGPVTRIIMRTLFAERDTMTEDGKIFYWDNIRIRTLIDLSTGIAMTILSLAPLLILWYMTMKLQIHNDTPVPIIIVLVSNILFFAMMTLVTRAKRHEILASTAGYCAVLVVFISNVNYNTD